MKTTTEYVGELRQALANKDVPDPDWRLTIRGIEEALGRRCLGLERLRCELEAAELLWPTRSEALTDEERLKLKQLVRDPRWNRSGDPDEQERAYLELRRMPLIIARRFRRSWHLHASYWMLGSRGGGDLTGAAARSLQLDQRLAAMSEQLQELVSRQGKRRSNQPCDAYASYPPYGGNGGAVTGSLVLFRGQARDPAAHKLALLAEARTCRDRRELAQRIFEKYGANKPDSVQKMIYRYETEDGVFRQSLCEAIGRGRVSESHRGRSSAA